ncbi:MAG: GNAT family N-acetyltransferase [Bacteroidales bacterium]|nr:GNAT family N-acetyltransferase [Bacteroidales bacterium]
MKDFSVRMATEADGEGVLAVYAPYIRYSAITFEYEVPDAVTFTKRIGEVLREYPYLVCCRDGIIVGFAYAHRQMARAAYQWNAELSVYLAEGFQGYGIGKALYYALIELLKQQNVQNLYGGLTVPNAASEGLHRFFGFKPAGIYHHTGYKCGKWHDVMWFEKSIGSHGASPEPLRAIGTVKREAVDGVLADCLRFIRSEKR